MRDHRQEFRLTSMCRVLKVHRSGYYAWLKEPESKRSKEDRRLLKLIKESYISSGQVYGSPRVYRDVRESGEQCGLKRVARIMRQNGIRARIGYKKPRFKSGKATIIAPNQLQQNFDFKQPDEAWVTDITFIRTYEGWLYLAAVMDLYSRMIVGWSMKSTLHRDLVLDAILMAVWRRNPKKPVIIHSDQGGQYGSDDWMRFCKEHGLSPSMSRSGNCYDNAVAESLFSSLKKERIRRRIYNTRDDAKSDVFDYIELFYNPRRRHSYLDYMSPRNYELANCETI
jgi:putative transposase